MNFQKKDKKSKKNNKGIFGWIILTLAILWIVNIFATSNVIDMYGAPKEISYGEFYRILKEDPLSIKSLEKIDITLRGELDNGERFFLLIPEDDKELLSLIRENVYNFTIKVSRNIWANQHCVMWSSANLTRLNKTSTKYYSNVLPMLCLKTTESLKR